MYHSGLVANSVALSMDQVGQLFVQFIGLY
jgi:hypothetical protein